jgi:hypothetical protein
MERIDREAIRRKAAEIHKENTRKVAELLQKDYDLHNLHTVLDAETADVYRTVLPRYAELCALDQQRGLTDVERAELAVKYASLYPAFGDEGTVFLAATWLATKPVRQARNRPYIQ